MSNSDHSLTDSELDRVMRFLSKHFHSEATSLGQFMVVAAAAVKSVIQLRDEHPNA
jgi:hypothetical protein